MLFSSIPFLYYFLPLVLAVYFLTPRAGKNAVLFLSSLLFYAWGEPRFCIFMLLSILQGYVFGRLIEKYAQNKKRSKLFLTASVALSLALLAYCKYADFFIQRKCRNGAVFQASARHAPHRHQFLHVPDFKLCGRCVPRRGSGAEKLFEARNIYRDVSAAHCRTDCAVRRDCAAAGQPPDDARRCIVRRVPVCDRVI
ncbi:MAG: hypothetical protein V8S92_01295 [Oscillospiraceae bacterium]